MSKKKPTLRLLNEDISDFVLELDEEEYTIAAIPIVEHSCPKCKNEHSLIVMDAFISSSPSKSYLQLKCFVCETPFKRQYNKFEIVEEEDEY